MSEDTRLRLEEALRDHIDSLAESLGPASRERVMRFAVRDQLGILRGHLGETPLERAIDLMLGRHEDNIDGIPVGVPQLLPEDWQHLSEVSAAVFPSVGQLAFEDAGGALVPSTGWLVEWNGRRDLIVTNAHVIRKIALTIYGEERDLRPTDVGQVRITFDERPTSQSPTHAAAEIYPHPHADFTDLAVVRLAADVPDGVSALALSSSEPAGGDLIFAIGYPGLAADAPLVTGLAPIQQKRRLISAGAVLDLHGSSIKHNCTTYSGSSGSPLFDGEGKVTAVHDGGRVEEGANYGIVVSELRTLLESV